MGPLPSRIDVSPSPDDPKVLDIDGDEAEAAFDALGSETARLILAAVYREPRTPPEIREAVGTTLQNVHYHLDGLEDAGLIERVGTGYSSKGTEMAVYGPSSVAVVLFAGRDDDSSRVRAVLAEILGLSLLVVLSTFAFAGVHRRMTDDPGTDVETLDGPGSAAAADSAASTVTAIDPVTAFFLGGCGVVLAVAAWRLLRPRLRSWRSSR